MCSAQMFIPLKIHLEAIGYQVTVIQFTTEQTVLDMVSLCQNKITTPGTVLGFSMGGIVALELVKQCPDLVESLILLSANSHKDKVGKDAIRRQHIKQAKSEGLEYVLMHYYLPNYFYNDLDINTKLVIDMANELGIHCFESQLSALSTRNDNLEVLATYKKRVLIVAGKNDLLCPISEQLKMSNIAQQATLALIENCGHFPLQEKEQLSIQSITNWLKTATSILNSTESSTCH